MTPGVLIGGQRSGSGKTTVALALTSSFRRRGLAVRSAKAGPDYIDAAFHAAATGTSVFNLDSWAMTPTLLDQIAAEAARGADLVVVESAMGLFDGVAGPRGRRGTGADLASRFHLPVILVLDVSGQIQSAAAVTRGFLAHDTDVKIAGVVLNRLGSARHQALATEAIAVVGVPVLGALPRDSEIAIPERHLGLVQASEQTDLGPKLERLADLAEEHLDLEAILALAKTACLPEANDALVLHPPGQRIALASDAAFTFVYPHLLEGWRRAGAEVIPFSPLADEPPRYDCDVCWLPGGYPELFAGQLSRAPRFRSGLAHFAKTRPVHGECGGYMVLGKGIEDASGAFHAMAGLLGHSTSFKHRRIHLGYREAKLLAPSPIGPPGASVRGHEFHYATIADAGHDEPLANLFSANGDDAGPSGARRGNVTGAFFHLIAPAE